MGLEVGEPRSRNKNEKEVGSRQKWVLTILSLEMKSEVFHLTE